MGKVNIKKEKLLFFFILLIAIVTRMFMLGSLPRGINQDEAFAGYEAWSLLHYGTDSAGYHNPVYFTAWGSGMNVLNSYLMIPLIKLFGFSVITVRIPQAIISVFSVLVLYLLLKKMFSEKFALMGMFLMAICPWSIMMARWGLESNLAPGMLLFGLYFWVLGMDKSKYLVVSAFFYGLSLYAYATLWPILPGILLLQCIYAWVYKKIRISKETMVAFAVLFVLALPLMLFLLVNRGIIPEISTSFFSIPKLVFFRGGEFSLDGTSAKLYSLYETVVQQNDGLLWNTTSEFGLYYGFSIPFALLGVVAVGKNLIKSMKERTYNIQVFIMIQFICAVIFGMFVQVNTNRINFIHISMIILIAAGIEWFIACFKSEMKYAVIIAYAVSFLAFFMYYRSSYADQIAVVFQSGLSEAVQEAERLCPEEDTAKICVTDTVSYSKILFLTEVPTDEFRDTVVYTNYPSAFLNISDFGNFHFGYNVEGLEGQNVYIIPSSQQTVFREKGWTVRTFENFSVANLE